MTALLLGATPSRSQGGPVVFIHEPGELVVEAKALKDSVLAVKTAKDAHFYSEPKVQLLSSTNPAVMISSPCFAQVKFEKQGSEASLDVMATKKGN